MNCRNAEREKPSDFVISSECLQERMTVNEIEQREIVTDPLHAVPEIPFGHLNEAWRKFISHLTPNREIWSFAGVCPKITIPTRSHSEFIQGYAIIQNHIVLKYFLTFVKYPYL